MVCGAGLDIYFGFLIVSILIIEGFNLKMYVDFVAY